jgi:hypothetical protein
MTTTTETIDRTALGCPSWCSSDHHPNDDGYFTEQYARRWRSADGQEVARDGDEVSPHVRHAGADLPVWLERVDAVKQSGYRVPGVPVIRFGEVADLSSGDARRVATALVRLAGLLDAEGIES